MDQSLHLLPELGSDHCRARMRVREVRCSPTKHLLEAGGSSFAPSFGALIMPSSVCLGCIPAPRCLQMCVVLFPHGECCRAGSVQAGAGAGLPHLAAHSVRTGCSLLHGELGAGARLPPDVGVWPYGEEGKTPWGCSSPSFLPRAHHSPITGPVPISTAPGWVCSWCGLGPGMGLWGSCCMGPWGGVVGKGLSCPF